MEDDFRIEDIVAALAWQDGSDLSDIKKMYHAKFNSDLQLDLENIGGRRNLPVLRVLCAEGRDEGVQQGLSYKGLVQQNATWLTQAIKGKDKDEFKVRLNNILSQRSWDILPDILEEFEQQNGKDLAHYMKKMIGSKVAGAFHPLFFVLDEPSAFFAEELFAAVEGLVTKDSKLQFIFSSRAEIDLLSIDSVFKKMFDKRLSKVVKEETSGNYKKLLLAILGT
ncbi:annexin A7 [Eurytemora carolleeae]|uniref:annexin A7 n=1 Tax=Eurytemora carolleeae TaxID=1294199 RepID=UPI000C76C69D|nr:annexin A7 [Eurytemora carolleeae]|eukprot:XP_023343623.1 annexin A7-like [Eurytemora affinis]